MKKLKNDVLLIKKGLKEIRTIRSGFIGLKEWRYYNDGEISTLTLGIEAYPEEKNFQLSKLFVLMF